MPHYLHGHAPSVVASHARRGAADSAAYLLPHLRPGLRILDVGCGPGTITLDLAEAVGPTGSVVGIDDAPAAIEAAAQEAVRRGDHRTRFELGDGSALALPDGDVDVAHAHQVLQHVADPVAVLGEMARVTRPGGLVAARDADYAAMAWHPSPQGLDAWRDVYRRAARAAGGEPDAGRHLRGWAREAGLSDVAVTASTWCYACAEATAWWGGSWADRIASSAFADSARALGCSDADLDAMAAAWRAWGREPDAWFVIVHAELLARV